MLMKKRIEHSSLLSVAIVSVLWSGFTCAALKHRLLRLDPSVFQCDGRLSRSGLGATLCAGISSVSGGATCRLVRRGLSVSGLGLSVVRSPSRGVVTGTVLAGGKVVENVLVKFTPSSGCPSTAITDSKGRYSLRCSAADLGQHTVSVSTIPLDKSYPTVSLTLVPKKLAQVHAGNNVIDLEY